MGVVVLSPLLGRSATAPKHQQRLMLLAMVTLDAVTGIWMVLQYAYEVQTAFTNDNGCYCYAFQQMLGVCGTRLFSPGWLVLGLSVIMFHSCLAT